MKTRNMLLTLVFGAGICLSGCNLGDFGEVEQGRCVGVNADGKTVSVLLDTAKNPKAPEYTKVAEFSLPDDPKEMGPEPRPGNLVAIDLEKKVLKVYNPATKAVEDMAVEFSDSRKGVVSADPAVKGKKFPVKGDNSVTLYSEAQKILVTVKADAALMAKADTLSFGDIVRFYYKPNVDKKKMLRFMNVSQTNIMKK